ncbi:GIY-YIG nuclease family protein [Rhizobium sp. CB3090]|uniref:GIY-YIG nuclease family protein n=1 Tax=Rhizobium sp. CB3090 TaxID=3039156 RepID=UPI0024B1D40F|nr:GIY-YIG nuclease family protein [Rhizobium sp. CB3090]WFU09782.1 GIY-YIG nuclease family protein [Rhizobium sp. CB3090]
MNHELIRQEIISKIKDIAQRDGKAPGREKFQGETGIGPHTWRGRIWRSWTDALADAGFEPNEYQAAFDSDDLLQAVAEIASRLGRFPTTGDIEYEFPRLSGAPSSATLFARWKMAELAAALAEYAERRGDYKIASFARDYVPPRRNKKSEVEDAVVVGYVYMQRHGSDYKIGYTKSLNKRGRQIQIELPQKIELVHSILTDDPAGIEAYWHKRFSEKRTRGEWFKLTKADITAFKRWSKIW